MNDLYKKIKTELKHQKVDFDPAAAKALAEAANGLVSLNSSVGFYHGRIFIKDAETVVSVDAKERGLK